ncbi:hypothetical protein ACFQZC_28310 [Streptacidiphilus monticola]
MPPRVLLLGLLLAVALAACLVAQPQHWFTAAQLHALGPWAPRCSRARWRWARPPSCRSR